MRANKFDKLSSKALDVFGNIAEANQIGADAATLKAIEELKRRKLITDANDVHK